MLNEIMYGPVAPEPEWIELFNAGDAPVDVSGWSVTDADTSARKHLPSGVPKIGAGAFAVLTRDTLTLGVRRALPGGTLIQLTSFPSLNNTGDLVALYDQSGAMIDRVRYTPPAGTSGTGGRSLERVDPHGESSEAGNWQMSHAATGATPCAENSVLKLPFDVRLRAMSGTVFTPFSRQEVQVLILNRGRYPAGPVEVFLYDDASADSLPDDTELVTVNVVQGPIPPGDSTAAALVWDAPFPGRHGLIALARFDTDGRPEDNQVSFQVDVAYPSGWVVLNEFLYEPLQGGSEFVELVNVSERPVAMAGWSVTDGGPGSEIPAGVVLGPGGILVVAADSSLVQSFPEMAGAGPSVVVTGKASLGLNNEGDGIFLLDPAGCRVDSLVYSPLWHNPAILDHAGRSLEKLHPDNPSHDARFWSTCVDPRGGTPLRQNSIFTPRSPHSVRMSVSPNPFSPDNDGHEDFMRIEYTLPSLANSVTITIFDTAGRRRRLLLQSEASGPQGGTVWDGCDDDRRRVRVGAYIVVLEACDASGAGFLTARRVAVVAGRL